jgi:dTDP-L-rhamnose 4-epimerase
VGSHVVDGLVDAGAVVTVLDRRFDVDPSRNPGADYRTVDLTDGDALRAALPRRLDAVSHQAARVGLGRDLRDAPGYAADNDLGTAMLLAVLHQRGFAGRLVLASSMVVYGEGRYRCTEHGIVRPLPRSAETLATGCFEPGCPACGSALVAEPVPEDAPADPRSVYAATKLHQEHLVAAYARETGAPAISLRYHNVYGPRMPRDTPYAGVASLFASALAAGRAPRVFEDGRQARDFVHVADVARANLLALTAPATVAGPFNVASGTPRTVAELAMAIAAAFPDAPAPQITGEWRLGDVRHVFASPLRAAEVLGFRADVPFGTGMAELSGASAAP